MPDVARAELVQATSRSRYGRVAGIYDLLGHAWSLGAIAAARRAHLHELRPGERVLYAGAGTGADALAAARLGARVTVADLDGAMIARARARFARAGLDARFVHGNVLELDARGEFDAICAHFFLDVFAAERLDGVLGALLTLMADDGRMYVADFAPPRGSAVARAGQRVFHDLPLVVFRAIVATDHRDLDDLGPVLERNGLRVRERRPVRLGRLGPAWLESIAAERTAP